MAVYPAAGYPANSVSGATLLLTQQVRNLSPAKVPDSFARPSGILQNTFTYLPHKFRNSFIRYFISEMTMTLNIYHHYHLDIYSANTASPNGVLETFAEGNGRSSVNFGL